MYLPTMPEVCEFKSDLHLMGTYYSKQLILCLQCKYYLCIHIVCENNHRFLVIVDDVRELLYVHIFDIHTYIYCILQIIRGEKFCR